MTTHSFTRHHHALSSLGLAIGLLVLPAWNVLAESTVKDTMLDIRARFLNTLSERQLLDLTEDQVQKLVTPEEKLILATRYWYFDANVPVVVSVMRNTAQKVVPFWLPKAGFVKSGKVIKNTEYTYEIWQKTFPAGHVALGINGFDKNRPHYFVSVGPEKQGDDVQLTNIFPADQKLFTLKQGEHVYHDWPDLLLTDIPEEMQGQILLPTIRGRAREANLVEGFRKTLYPSSATPDQIVLTWSDDPRTSQTIQWRTNPSIAAGLVRYQEKGSGDNAGWIEVPATCESIEDRLLMNDWQENHFTAALTALKPGTAYVYTVGDPQGQHRSEPAEFTTEPEGDHPFKFAFFSDTHNSKESGQLMVKALKRDPDLAFSTITGDLVGCGQYREDWDNLFCHAPDYFKRLPFVPVMGNHDTIDGLGADLYRGFFGLPKNGPDKVIPEMAYHFQYSNVLFLALDVTSELGDQRAWLEEQLATTKAAWKIAMFHFPPYDPEECDPTVLPAWGDLFDKYHVDLVLNGHMHHYVRTHPMNQQVAKATPAEGTIYVTVGSVPGAPRKMKQPDFCSVMDLSGVPMYVLFQVEGNHLTARCIDFNGKIRDEFTIDK